jgi:DNA-binding NtrC family response regulator
MQKSSSAPEMKENRLERGAARRIFVVDDEGSIVDGLTFILRKGGYDVRSFCDARGVLLQAQVCPPEVVISDILMPGMNGLELAVVLTHRFPRCKVLLLSCQASVIRALATDGSREYRFECLAKPVHPLDLLIRVATLERGDRSARAHSGSNCEEVGAGEARR